MSTPQGAPTESGSRRGGRGGRRKDTDAKTKPDTTGPPRDEKKPRDDRKSRVKKEKVGPSVGSDAPAEAGGTSRGRRRDAPPKRDAAAPTRGRPTEPTASPAPSVTTVVQSASKKKRSSRDKKEKRERGGEKERKRGGRDRKGRDKTASATASSSTSTKPKPASATTVRAPRSTTRVLRMGLPIDSLTASDDVHLLTLRNLEWGVTEKDITSMIGAEAKLRDLLGTGGIKVQYVSKGHGRRPVAALTPQEAISRSSFAPMIGSGLFDTSVSEPILAHYASYFGGKASSTVPAATPSISTSHAIVFVANPAHIPLVAAVFDGKEVGSGQQPSTGARLQCVVEHAPTQPTSCRPPTLPAGGNLYSDGDFYLFAQKMVRQQRAVEGHVDKLDARLAAATVVVEGGGSDKPQPTTLRSRLPQPSAVSEGGLSSVVSKPPGGKVDGIGFDFAEVEIAALERGLKEVEHADPNSSPSGTTPEEDADDAVKMRLQAWVMASQAAEMKRELQVRSVFDGEDVVDADESEVGQNKMLAAVMKSWVGPSGVTSSRGGRRTATGTGEGVVLQQLRDARREEKDKAEAERIHKIIEARRTEKKERDAEIRRKEQAASDAARQLGVLTEPTSAPADVTPPRTEPTIRIAKRQTNTTQSTAQPAAGAASSSSFTVTSSRQGAGVMGVKKR